MQKIEQNLIILNKDECFDKQDIINLNRLQKELIEKENILASIEECANMWQRYSSDLCASWLIFPDNDNDILMYILSSDYFTNFEDYLTN
jgi:aspartate carbamoyltransferase catalytic subunit